MERESIDMDLSDIRELLPLYVAKTLEAGQRQQVERALDEHPELREDLAFWQGAQRTTSHQVRWEGAGHLTTHDLVDYAEGRLSDAEVTRSISDHLGSCAACMDIYEMLSATLDTVPVSGRNVSAESSVPSRFRSFAGRFFEALRGPRLLAPAAALVLVALIAFNSVREVDTPGQLFRIRYQSQSRSAAQADLPVLDLAAGNLTTLQIELPDPGIAEVGYSVALADSTRQWRLLDQHVSAKEAGMMVVTVSVLSEDNFLSGGLHFLCVEEVLTDTMAAMGLTSQQYILPFRVTGQDDNAVPGQR